MKKVKFCLIGAGRAGMVNARNFEFNIAESEVVAIVDPNLEAARKAAEELNANDYYNSLDEALIKSDFDMDKFKEIAKEAVDYVKKTKASHTKYGTAQYTAVMNEFGAYPTRNFQTGVLKVLKLSRLNI